MVVVFGVCSWFSKWRIFMVLYINDCSVHVRRVYELVYLVFVSCRCVISRIAQTATTQIIS